MDIDVLELARSLRAALTAFDPSLLSGEDSASAVGVLGATERACAAARARATARAAACGAHRAQGYADPADWLAREAATSRHEARRELETTAALSGLDATRAAVESGEVSLRQAEEITKTEAVVPGSEAALLVLARTKAMHELRERARRTRQRAIDADELYSRQRAARSFRHFIDELGMVRGSFSLTPDVGIPFLSRLEAETKRVREAADRAIRDLGGDGATQVEPWEAHAADALVRLVMGSADESGDRGGGGAGDRDDGGGGGDRGGGGAERGDRGGGGGEGGRGGGGGGGWGRADVVFVVDLNAYRRGQVEGDEVCHVVGGGPVPVGLVHEVARDAFLKGIVHDGVEIRTVRHFGRHLPAALRTALELGAPPELNGVACSCGCGKRYGLAWDHIDPVANNGPTCSENLQPLGWLEHKEKTERDREAGLLGRRSPPASRGEPRAGLGVQGDDP